MHTKRPYFAHSTSRPDRADWQLLREHLHQVADLARAHAAKFGAGEWGYVAGLLHDLGKYSADFQRYLEGGPGGVDHSTAGARIVVERFGPQIGKLLAFCIAGHHAGLANGVGGTNRSALENRLDLKRVIPNIDAVAWSAEIPLPNRLEAPQLSPAPAPFSGFDVPFFTRMLFSCLIDADRTNTRDFDLRSKGITPEERDRPSLAELRERLDAHFVRLHEDLVRRSRAEAPINLRRAEILAHVRAHARADQGVFTLTVPTGGGKTLTSLAFALDHALAQEEPLERIIYVIPFTSIIEQTAEVFREALQTDDPAVLLEHHSAFDLEGPRSRDNRDEERRDGSEPIRLAMETWDSRIVVTTAVQFFESLFADRTTRCRKLHNVARSVVILDEAQTLPLPFLLPCIAGLQELARNYGTSIVLCTATQPALKKRADFQGGFESPPEIAPKGLDAEPVFQRVHIEVVGRLSDNDLAERLSWHAVATIFHGWALVDGDEIESGITEMRRGLAALQATGMELQVPHCLGLLASACTRANDPAALDLLAEALERVDRTEERWFEAELYRLKGEALLALSPERSAEAEVDYRQALVVARSQGARLWELRAATSLARLWRDQGRLAEAHDLLAPVYGWFTEGFDTPDLEDARALLDALA